MKKKGLIFLIPPKTILISQLWMFTVRKKLVFFFFGKKRKDKYCSTVHRQMYAIKRNVSKNTEAV